MELTCSKNQQNPIRQKAVTAKNGIFLLKKPKQLNLDDFRSCKASLLSSSIHSSCNNPTDLNFGLSGSSLTLMHRITTLRKQLNYEIFTIKSFAFEPTAEKPCDDREPYETDEVICNPACVLINYGCYCWMRSRGRCFDLMVFVLWINKFPALVFQVGTQN